MRVAGAELAFVEQVLDPGGDANVFGQDIAGAGPHNDVRADFAFFSSSKRFALIIVLFRLLTAVPSQNRLYRQILGGLPAPQDRFEGELRDHREVIDGALING